MATIREKRPGYWEVREFVGRDASGRPIQVSRPVRGTKKDALAVAAALRVYPTSREGASVTVAEMLDLWVAQHEATWAPTSFANQVSRVRLVKGDPIARTRIVQLTAVEFDEWHERLARRGVGEGSIPRGVPRYDRTTAMTSRSHIPSVVGVAVIEPHVMRVLFDDDVVRDVRFIPGESDGSIVRELDDPTYFARVRVDPEVGTVVWPNGLDLAPEVLHGDHEPVDAQGFHDVTAARLTA